MKSLNYPNCGAALAEKNIKSDIASCEYCGTTFRIPKTYSPEPDMGDLILGADFKSEMMPGWEIFNRRYRKLFLDADLHGLRSVRIFNSFVSVNPRSSASD
jgi:hypothetical protein